MGGGLVAVKEIRMPGRIVKLFLDTEETKRLRFIKNLNPNGSGVRI
ncbi:hypothetical protein [Bifidobacterium psychraerophilum]